MRHQQILVVGGVAVLFALFAATLLFPAQFAAQADEVSPDANDMTVTPQATDTTPLPTMTITPTATIPLTATPIPPTSTPIALQPLEEPGYAGLVVAYGDGNMDKTCVNLADVRAAGKQMTVEGVLNTLDTSEAFSITMGDTNSGKSICAIEGKSGNVGCPATSCTCDPNGNYWATFTTTSTVDSQQWISSTTVITNTPVETNTMIGLSWTTLTEVTTDTYEPLAPPPFHSFEETCSFTRHAGVVVDYLDGSYDTACVDLGSKGEMSAEEVLRSAQSVSTTIARDEEFGVSIVCAIEGSSSAGYPPDECLLDHSADEETWAFWKLTEDQSWKYVPTGISSVIVKPGEIIGFSWTAGTQEGGSYTPSTNPRGVPFSQICNESRGLAGLVVSDGSTFDSRCVELGSDGQASGEEILRASELDIILETSSSDTFVCKIGESGCNYPDEECRLCSSNKSWSYWHLEDEEWKPQPDDIASSTILTGDVAGFSWTGYDNRQRPIERPIARSFNRICVSPLVTEPPVILAMQPSSGLLNIQGKNFTRLTRVFLLRTIEAPASALASTRSFTDNTIELNIKSPRSEDELRAVLPASLPQGSYSLVVQNSEERFDALEAAYTVENTEINIYLPLVER